METSAITAEKAVELGLCPALPCPEDAKPDTLTALVGRRDASALPNPAPAKALDLLEERALTAARATSEVDPEEREALWLDHHELQRRLAQHLSASNERAA